MLSLIIIFVCHALCFFVTGGVSHVCLLQIGLSLITALHLPQCKLKMLSRWMWLSFEETLAHFVNVGGLSMADALLRVDRIYQGYGLGFEKVRKGRHGELEYPANVGGEVGDQAAIKHARKLSNQQKAPIMILM